ncbi:hypothetical protein HII36_33270 [Nonomuraea sp. NN258]|uniref:hypothetical protein n=1 Tax=Nonomuraea antri TaxID=2730852 RepID=UPI00156A71CB|nr:hypothetical protein [Nonomuraea antri]NRQ36670.1 hypothetical protein [Nonomuraea antri]
MAASLRSSFWSDAPGYQRMAYLVGAALILVGLTHAAIWAVVGGTAEGPLSWRKPTTFGISFGLTTLTLGWFGTYLPVRRWIGWVTSSVLCLSTTLEVVYVSVQRARGVPSHFNNLTALDEALFTAGGITIAFTDVVILAMTVASFVICTAPAPMTWAIRGGLVALLAAQGMGAWMIVHGIGLLDEGATALTQSMTTYGAAGSMKFTHAVPMHGIQVLAGLAWLLGFTGLSVRRQSVTVGVAIAGYASLFAVALARTAAGLEPFDLVSASTLLYLAPAVLLGAAAVAAAAGLRPYPHSPARL